MEISEVRVKMVANKDDRLKAFCSMTLDDDFLVRDFIVIDVMSRSNFQATCTKLHIDIFISYNRNNTIHQRHDDFFAD